MKIATFEGGARCPVCRADFETITDYGGNYTMDLKTNTLFRRGEDNTMVSTVVLSEMEMILASRIVMAEDLDENGKTSAKFYMPQFIHGLLGRQDTALVTYDADDGLCDKVMTRSDYASFWYDKDIYKQIVVDTVGKLQNVVEGSAFPLFVLKAVVGKAFMEMVYLGKLIIREIKSLPEHPTDDVHHIMTMPYPADFMTNIAVI